jgi:hypothetical protein
METPINDDDQKWIDSAATTEAKAVRKTAILNLIEMNGLKFDAGIGKSYIPEKNYFQILADKSLPKDVNDIATSALNWDALGRGIGGLAGAGVRAGIFELVDRSRECTTHVKYTEAIDTIVTEYVAFTSTRKDIFPFWATQAYNVLGLAAAIFNREMHHWNAENTKPQLALLAALNQQDTIPDSELRKLFYLSIHPIPLRALESVRQSIVNGKQPGINDAVTTRCRSAPAGTGDIHACAQAIADLTSEAFYGKFGESIKNEIHYLINLNIEVINNAGAYHAFAANYGKDRILIDRIKFKRAMICLCAYINVNVKGSLAASAALKKFKNANSRMVQKWIAAFEAQAGVDSPSLVQLAGD